MTCGCIDCRNYFSSNGLVYHEDLVTFKRHLYYWLFCGWIHDDVIKWKYFPCYWPFVREIHRSPVNSQHKGQWRGALMFSLICTWINGWVNNHEAGELRRYSAHYDVIVMHRTAHRVIMMLNVDVFVVNNWTRSWTNNRFADGLRFGCAELTSR